MIKKLLLLCMLIASGNVVHAGYYVKVTSSSDLVDGGTYILVSYGTNDTYVASSFSTNALLSTTTGFTVSDDIIVSISATFLELTLGTVTGGFTLKDGSNYLTYSGSSTDLSESTKFINPTAIWAYTYVGEYNVYTIKNGYTSTARYLALSSKTGDCKFKAYNAVNINNPNAYLYKKENAVDKLTATVTSAGYATFVPPHNVEFAPGDAYVITAANDVVTMQGVTQVPAGTPVLLKGEGTKEATVLDSEVAAPAQNLLQVSDGSINADSHVYVLSKKNGKVGFYLWTGDSLDAGKVYLTIPESAREFIGFDDATTGIFQTSDAREQVKDAVYDLQGRYKNVNRKSANGQVQRGLSIVNGKKVLIK